MWHNTHLLSFNFCRWDIRAHSGARLSLLGSHGLKLRCHLSWRGCRKKSASKFIVVDSRIQSLGVLGLRFQLPHGLLAGAVLTSLGCPHFFTCGILYLWLFMLCTSGILPFLHSNQPILLRVVWWGQAHQDNLPVFKSSGWYNITLTLKPFCYEKPAQICSLFLDEWSFWFIS